MSPEVSTALIGFVVALLGMGVAIFAFLPSVLKRQADLNQKKQEQDLQKQQQEQESKLAAEKAARDEALENAKQERAASAAQQQQFTRLIDTLITERNSATQQNEVMVRALTSSVAVLDGMAKELRANTAITSETSKGYADFMLAFNEFLETGTKPFQRLSQRVDEMAAGVAAVVLNQRDTTDKVNIIHEKIGKIDELLNTLQIMKKVAEATIDDVRKSTGENSTISLSAPST